MPAKAADDTNTVASCLAPKVRISLNSALDIVLVRPASLNMSAKLFIIVDHIRRPKLLYIPAILPSPARMSLGVVSKVAPPLVSWVM